MPACQGRVLVQHDWLRAPTLTGSVELVVLHFEAVSVHKFSYVITTYGLGSIPPELGQLVQVLPRVLTCASVDYSTEVRPDIQHHKHISLAVQSNSLLPHGLPVNVPFIERRHSSFEDACSLVVRGSLASGHCGPCWCLWGLLPLGLLPLGLLAPSELAPPELMVVQTILLHDPPEPEVCRHLRHHREFARDDLRVCCCLA